MSYSSVKNDTIQRRNNCVLGTCLVTYADYIDIWSGIPSQHSCLSVQCVEVIFIFMTTI
jgi:hypothetical protein